MSAEPLTPAEIAAMTTLSNIPPDTIDRLLATTANAMLAPDWPSIVEGQSRELETLRFLLRRSLDWISPRLVSTPDAKAIAEKLRADIASALLSPADPSLPPVEEMG